MNNNSKKEILVVGAGVSGLSAACYLSKYGYNVRIVEKNDYVGGRLRKLEVDGFTFDMGPSWYWMPDVFEKFYNDFGYTSSDFYELNRLDPSYKVFWRDSEHNIPASFEKLLELFENIEVGSSKKLISFLDDAKYKYEVGMGEFVEKPSLSITEYIDIKLLLSGLRLDLLKSITKSIYKNFKNPKLRQLLEFPVLFLGAKPSNTPALYSMMNYADIKLGTWYPMGGMYKIAESFEKIAINLGVQIELNQSINKVKIENNLITNAFGNSNNYSFSHIVNAADYHHFEQKILPIEYREYNEKYWASRVFAPTCLLFYIGVNSKLPNLEHHNLFFDTDFELHSASIYDNHDLPDNPLFYVSCTSKTDLTAPTDSENLFILIPLSTQIELSDENIEYYFTHVIERIESRINKKFKDDIIFKKSYSKSDFIEDYNSYKGNAYGLANTLSQTAFLKPKMKNKQIRNLYYAGQLTVPGPGLPPSIISGRIVANLIKKESL